MKEKIDKLTELLIKINTTVSAIKKPKSVTPSNSVKPVKPTTASNKMPGVEPTKKQVNLTASIGQTPDLDAREHKQKMIDSAVPAASNQALKKPKKAGVSDNTVQSALETFSISKSTGQWNIEKREELVGGLGDGKKDSEFDAKELEAGQKVEREHTKDKKAQKEIARDHLTEDPKYYTHLKEMEDKYQD